MPTLTNRVDFVLLFDVTDGNPNGDPDAGNLPRIDPETGQGLVTDVCLKRKVRNYVQLAQAGVEGYDIYVKEKAVLSAQQGRAYAALGIESAPVEHDEAAAEDEGESLKKKKEKKPQKKATDGDNVVRARDWMCKTFFDVRAFGAVMSLKENNAGQVRGPVQLTFARSAEPVIALEHAITRMAVATQKEAENQGGENRTMGRKATIPYGLYRAHGFVSPALAAQTSFDAADLALLYAALAQMFEHDRSAARGLMATRALVVFERESALGGAPSHRLFERVAVTRRDASRPARAYTDYDVTLDGAPLDPARVHTSVRVVATG